HASSPLPSCRSTTSLSPFTVSKTPPSVSPRPSPVTSPKSSHGEGRTRLRRDHRAVAHEKGQPRRAALTTSATSVTPTSACIVILDDRGQQVLRHRLGTPRRTPHPHARTTAPATPAPP